MDNQHCQIKGYRELSQAEIDLMNEIKTKGNEVGELIERLSKLHLEEMKTNKEHDPERMRWLAIGKTDLQKGLMALTRSVANPSFF